MFSKKKEKQIEALEQILKKDGPLFCSVCFEYYRLSKLKVKVLYNEPEFVCKSKEHDQWPGAGLTKEEVIKIIKRRIYNNEESIKHNQTIIENLTKLKARIEKIK